MIRNLLIFLSIIFLSACSTNPVGWGGKFEAIQSNSQSITFKYDTVLGKNAIFEEATKHCSQHGKEPVPTTKSTQSLGIALQTFECR